MIALLAGRAAEDVVFGEVSTGAADDLVKATDIARESITRFGMNTSLGQAVLEPRQTQWLDGNQLGVRPRDYSEATAREVDLAIRAMIDEAYRVAKEMLSARIEDLKAGARLLLERETITPADFAPLQRRTQSPQTQSPENADTAPRVATGAIPGKVHGGFPSAIA